MATFRSFTGYLSTDLGVSAQAPLSGDTFNIASVAALNIVVQDDDADGDIGGDVTNEASSDADQFIFAEQGGALLGGGALNGEQFYLEATFTFTVAGDPSNTVYTGYSFEGDSSGVDFIILPPDVPAGVASVTGTDFNPSPNAVDYDALSSGDEIISEATASSLNLSGDDTIRSGDGDDTITDNGGSNAIFGGAGDDTIVATGAVTTNAVFGNDGEDNITVFNAAASNNTIDGGADDDTIQTGDSTDTIFGGTGNDTIDAGRGDDRIDGEAGNDDLTGFEGADTIDGGEGDDTIDGGDGNDTLDGNSGNDTIDGGDGDDIITGDGDERVAPEIFLSEVEYVGGSEANDEFVEVTVSADQDLSDYTISFYSLPPGSPAGTSPTLNTATSSSFFPGQAEITLQEILDQTGGTLPQPGAPVSVPSTVGGLDLEIAVHPTETDYLVITLPASLSQPIGGSAEVFALTNTATGTVINAVDIGSDDGWGPLSGGVADGATPVSINGDADFLDGELSSDGTFTGTSSADNSAGDSVFATRPAVPGDDIISGGAGNDTIDAGGGDDTIDGGADDDTITGGEGDDTFVETAGDGADTITDFNVGNSGSIDDGDQTNNDFVDLNAFYNETTRDAVNNADADPSNDFGNALGMLRADAADGQLDGIIDGVDYSAQIGDIDLTLQDGSGGSVTGTDLTFDNTNVVCFARGTLITTDQGDLPIEHLRVGSRVLTMDNGYQSINWIGSKTLDAIDMSFKPQLRPVCIKAGALGQGMPEHDLYLSQQHRVLVRSKVAERMFGAYEILVPANKLLVMTGIDIVEDTQEVTYYHMLFERHEIVWSNAAPTESLFTGPEALKSVSPESHAEITSLFPEIMDDNYFPEPVRHIPQRGRRLTQLALRHSKNNKELVAPFDV